MPSATEKPPHFDSIEDTITAFGNGEFIIVLDSPDRENEGDLIISASHFTTSKAAFMIRHTSGLICAPLSPSLVDRLGLSPMVKDNENQDPNRTAYTISIDADDPSITTGISAGDRSLTCRLLADEGVQGNWFRKPGHVFPLRARSGGVRERRGHTEAAVEFCKLSGLQEAAVICELVEDGEEVEGGRAERSQAGMMRRDACLEFARKWGLRICTIESLVDWLDRRDEKEMTTTNGHA
ncbi:MAG: hypothetical protein M1823_002845 [Watsoniomyces obsoletus]|nr:MAG: hypothetical protein M1823_002845 [Watsoniomyces obsoletus]